jgi:hypothetical protein
MTRPRLSRLELVRRRGRRAGLAVFGLIVAAFTAVCATQIIVQAYEPRVVPSHVGCREGLRRLISAVRRARDAAGRVTAGERDALGRFRSELEPEWSTRPALGRICRGDRVAERALRVIDEYRYAEEHAVRYESADLSHRRQQIRRIEVLLCPGPMKRGDPAGISSD